MSPNNYVVKYVPRGSDQNISRSSVLAAGKKAAPVMHFHLNICIKERRKYA